MYQTFLMLCASLAAITCSAADEAFTPKIKEVKILTPIVRPGDPLVVDLTFEAEGTLPTIPYNGFLHIEREKTNPICITNLSLITFGIDWWATGGKTYQGIYSINVPPNTPEGERVLHLGFYREAPDFMAEATYSFTVDKNAPDTRPSPPPAMASTERGRRQAALTGLVDQPMAELANNNYRFQLAANGQWNFTDLAHNLSWTSNPDVERLGMAAFVRDGEKRVIPVTGLVLKNRTDKQLTFTFHAPDNLGEVEFTVTAKPTDDRALEFSWHQTGGDGQLSDLVFPENAFGATGEENAIALIPNAIGVLMYANENLPTRMSLLPYDSYGGLSMAMSGMVRADGGILFYWNDVDAALGVRRQWHPARLPGSTALDLSLTHPGNGSVTLVNVGSSDYCRVANAYRDGAREKGFLKTFVEKYGNGPNPIDGFMSYRPEAMMHRIPHTRQNPTDQDLRHLHYTFSEVADAAERIHDDWGVPKALIAIAGWGNCGYDFHPDVLPANAEAGGDEGLRQASDRIRALGYLIGGHDNYQDHYQTAPSWDEENIIRREDGSLLPGGEYAHGQCYIATTQAMLKFARHNIPEIKKRYGFNYHLIDTVFAVPLIRDYNPAQPASRLDDLRGKQVLCQYVHDTIGLVGSEEGVEWGVPVADYFDSLLRQRITHRSSDVVVPLFEMVYGDCISVYQGDRTTVATPNSILDHLLCAEMPQLMYPRFLDANVSVRLDDIKLKEDNTLEVNYTPIAAAGTTEPVTLIVHLAEAGKNLGQESALAGFDRPLSGEDWNRPQTARLALPDGTVNQRCELVAMLLIRHERVMMIDAVELGYSRYLLGTVEIADGKVELLPPVIPPECCFARLDSRPELSGTNGGLTINVVNIFGDIMDRTRNYPMTAHRFLTADRQVEQSEFGPVRITVNYGDTPFDTGRFRLPKWGFAVEAPDYAACRADRIDGVPLTETTMLSAAPEKQFFAYGDRQAMALLTRRQTK